MNEPELIPAMFARQPRTLAVIGLSERADRPSHYVSAYMQQRGYTLYPVNPSIQSVLGERSFTSLTELVEQGTRPTIVNVFRLPALIPAIVEEMIALNLTDLWVQQGIINLDAARRAEAAGIRVVMDRCIMVEHRGLLLQSAKP